MISTENKYGTVGISSEVMANIVGDAATSCYGVAEMVNKNTADGINQLLKKDGYEKGVRVVSENGKLMIELHIAVIYGLNIKAVCDSIVEKVSYTVEHVTGFEVGKVTVCVDKMQA